jgi:hypothetical protein
MLIRLISHMFTHVLPTDVISDCCHCGVELVFVQINEAHTSHVLPTPFTDAYALHERWGCNGVRIGAALMFMYMCTSMMLIRNMFFQRLE